MFFCDLRKSAQNHVKQTYITDGEKHSFWPKQATVHPPLTVSRDKCSPPCLCRTERSPCWERSPTSRPSSMTSLCWRPILTNCPQRVNRWRIKDRGRLVNKEPSEASSLSVSQVIKDLKGSDYSWSYQTPPSSPSSSGSRKSSMCRYTHTHTCVQTWPLSQKEEPSLFMSQPFCLWVSPSSLIVQSSSVPGISKETFSTCENLWPR